MKTKPEKELIHIVTLGCSKNLIDSEKLLKQLDTNGLHIIHNENSAKADIVIINTCGFIKDAKEESIDIILRFIKAKQRGDIRKVYVMGCLSERYKSELRKEIGEVDEYFGVNNIQDIIETLGYNYRENLIGERIITAPQHYAYLKISEGCDRQCSFCAIPLMRGKHRSRSIENILSEAQILVSQGVKELILIAQDLTYYGVDIYYKQKLSELLRQLVRTDKLEWIRLHYAYPAGFPKDVLYTIKQYDTICNYLDLPFQHISDSVLKKMRRGITQKQTYKLIEDIREIIPDIVLRTTLMVGHPGEDDRQFEELVEFVQKVRFDRLGVFTYSEEEDTYGANNYKDYIPEEVKQKRADIIMDIQRGISFNLNQAKVGKQIKVIIDGEENEYYIGRTEGDSPEVDNELIIRSKEKLKVGEFYMATISVADDFDLEAVVI